MFGFGKEKKLILQHKEEVERRKELFLCRGYLIEEIQGEGLDLSIDYKKSLVIPLWSEIFSDLDEYYWSVRISVYDDYYSRLFAWYGPIFKNSERFTRGIMGSDIDMLEEEIVDTAESIDLEYFLEKSIKDAQIAEANGGLKIAEKVIWQELLDHLR